MLLTHLLIFRYIVSDIALFVLKRDVKLQPTNHFRSTPPNRPSNIRGGLKCPLVVWYARPSGRTSGIHPQKVFFRLMFVWDHE